MAINNTGYSSNQFLNISEVESNPVARTTADNPDFLYPGHSIPNVYDDLSIGPLGRLPVQRGFIRGIFPEIVNRLQETSDNRGTTNRYTNISAPVRRCFFQFNPSMILRSVQASSTTLNPLLQNPTQLLQAIPGQASFEFQILFNREYEVAGQVYRTGNGKAPTTPYSQFLDNYGATSPTDDDPNTTDNDSRAANPYLQSHVGDLGVLTDLYILDSIIGQSITQDSIDSILAYWQASKNLRGTGEKDADGNEINPYKDGDFTDSGEYAKGLNNVLGNSAFLNPMPIRIVFSSLFMVEGFVTASNVAFHKFNENMVPTVCQVTLSVQALYIGFARKNSYITQQLEQQITQEIENAEADAAATKVAKIALEKDTQSVLANMRFSHAGWNTGIDSYVPDWDTSEYSLNKWWKAIHDANIAKYYVDPDRYYKLRYTLLGSTLSPTKSFRFWTSPRFKDLVNSKAAITNLSITSLKLYFYDASSGKLPAWATDDKLKELSNDGKLSSGNYKNLQPIAKCNVFRLDADPNQIQGVSTHDKTSLRDLESEKLIKGKKDDPYEEYWITDDMDVYGFDADRIRTNSARYFGDSVKILAQLTLTATFAGAGGGDVSTKVIKSVVHTLNSDTEFQFLTPFGIDFGFWWNNND